MTCQEFVDFLMQYLDRELAQGPERIFEEHMRLCPPCRTYLEQYRETVELGRSVCEAEDRLPGDVPQELVDAILAAIASEA